MLTVGSLFSGIGGIDLGLQRAGMTVKWHSEIDPFACRVLAKHWPNVPNLGDIKAVKWEEIENVDVIAGGYPCQPFSLAGQRQGENDPRHLWPFFRDAIRVLRPRYALLENVRGHLSLGGMSVIADLTDLGYNAEWRIISAASVGANHRRDRLIIVAYPYEQGSQRRNKASDSQRQNTDRHPGPCRANLAHSSGGTMEECRLREVFGKTAKFREPNSTTRAIGDWWQSEPNVGRVANGVPSRVDRLRGLGNAVVPQVAEIVGRLIMEHYENAERF